LLNLSRLALPNSVKVPRLLEIIGRAEADLVQARLRYKQYQSDAHIVHHDLSQWQPAHHGLRPNAIGL
jgi:DNA polymerase IIIc chi subunit